MLEGFRLQFGKQQLFIAHSCNVGTMLADQCSFIWSIGLLARHKCPYTGFCLHCVVTCSVCTAFITSHVQHLCIAQLVSSACNLESSVQQFQTCQPAMHDAVSARKHYFKTCLNLRLTNQPERLTQISSLQSKSKSTGKVRTDVGKNFYTAHRQVQGSAVGAVARDCTENRSLLFAQSLPLIRAGLVGQQAVALPYAIELAEYMLPC